MQHSIMASQALSSLDRLANICSDDLGTKTARYASWATGAASNFQYNPILKILRAENWLYKAEKNLLEVAKILDKSRPLIAECVQCL